MDMAFYQHLANLLQDYPVAVATVVQISGSVPREVGAKLMVWSSEKYDQQTDEETNKVTNAQTFGTIGGGAGEAKVLQQAQAVLATGQKQEVIIDLSGAPNRKIQGICGGQMLVWIERWQGEEAIALTQQILYHLNQGQSITLGLSLRDDVEDQPNPHFPCIIDAETFPDPQVCQVILHPPPTLLIVGAGHCGIQLAKVAALSGFQVMIQDGRPQWANIQNFPDATHIFHGAIAQVIDELAHYTQLYVALVTRGFDHDLSALKALLQRPTPCRYIGMMGSQKRIRTALQAVQQDTIIAEALQALQPLHAPIGLDIGALTPEEIAVSICAELIMVHRGGTGQPLSSVGRSVPRSL
ncbi:MAG: XdhC family protein [Merismopedia sp. SIO2A8]|nr:XdhC family protein [Merismopedia sp. SIO2A8]